MLKEISDEIRAAFQSNQNGVTQLLVINIVVFVIIGTINVFGWAFSSMGASQFVMDYFSLSSNLLDFVFHPWTLVTYSIVHLDLFHIVFNLLGLYWFGQILQDFLGPRKILNFYLFGALSGGLLFLIIFNLLGIRGMAPPTNHLIGASGAVYGIICGAAFLVPNYTIRLLLFGLVRLKYVALAFVLISFLQIPMGNPGGNIAHLGGALGGILYLKYLQGIFRFRWGSPKIKSTQLKGRVVKMDVGQRIETSPQEELDRLLDKISEKGMPSLSKEERNRLEYLSKITSSNE
jgi:membrane associated rhomboid family serine protease